MELAVIETGGKQYLVKPGQRLDVEKLPVEAKGAVTFDRVLLTVKDGTPAVGTPYLPGVTVSATCEEQRKTDKVTAVKFHNKTRHQRFFGHRQQVTRVRIEKIFS